MTIRETRQGDLRGLLELYAHLQKEGRLEPDLEAERVWRRILREENHHILVAEEGGRILSSCVCVVVPNLTHGQRPYALVENVVTHPDFRGRGLASARLAAARELAARQGCYKIMLMTGSKRESTLRLYERAGYNRQDKTAFVQWL